MFFYVASHDIKWYELQVELTDHMVTSMEEFWEKDPELTFIRLNTMLKINLAETDLKQLKRSVKY
jgi:hypothetical protein